MKSLRQVLFSEALPDMLVSVGIFCRIRACWGELVGDLTPQRPGLLAESTRPFALLDGRLRVAARDNLRAAALMRRALQIQRRCMQKFGHQVVIVPFVTSVLPPLEETKPKMRPPLDADKDRVEYYLQFLSELSLKNPDLALAMARFRAVCEVKEREKNNGDAERI